MSQTGSVLVLGDLEGRLGELASRARALGFNVLRAKTAPDALAAAEARGFRFRAVLIESDFAAADLDAALNSLRNHPCTENLAVIAVGESPGDEELIRLREAGIDRALWEPVGDHALRFELNRCFAEPGTLSDRNELRAPTEWNTRIFVAGRQKTASIYAISANGAFIATPRPQIRGAKVAIEVPLPSGSISLAATVVYANVPGNLRKSNLPSGMALLFEGASPEQISLVRSAVEDCALASRL
jgi:CheY-like chemotaxis protein